LAEIGAELAKEKKKVERIKAPSDQKDRQDHLAAKYGDIQSLILSGGDIDTAQILPQETLNQVVLRVGGGEKFDEVFEEFDSLSDEQQESVMDHVQYIRRSQSFDAEGMKDMILEAIAAEKESDIFVPPGGDDVKEEEEAVPETPKENQEEEVPKPKPAEPAERLVDLQGRSRPPEVNQKKELNTPQNSEPLLRLEFEQPNATIVEESTKDAMRDLIEFENFDVLLRTNPNAEPDLFDVDFLKAHTEVSTFG
jgi:hypothetical protein